MMVAGDGGPDREMVRRFVAAALAPEGGDEGSAVVWPPVTALLASATAGTWLLEAVVERANMGVSGWERTRLLDWLATWPLEGQVAAARALVAAGERVDSEIRLAMAGLTGSEVIVDAAHWRYRTSGGR